MIRFMKYCMVLAFVLLTLVLGGCYPDASQASEETHLAGYTMPEDYSVEVFEVESSGGFDMKQTEICHKKPANMTELWLEWKNRTEGQDKYDVINTVYHDDTEEEAEEEELERYCGSLFSNSCLQMEHIHDHNGCREVIVECDKYNDDDICIRFDIDIKEERLDEDVCS